MKAARRVQAILFILAAVGCSKSAVDGPPPPAAPPAPPPIERPPSVQRLDADAAGIPSSANPCAAARIDLVRALDEHVCDGKFDPRPDRSLYDANLEVRVTPSATTIKSGGHLDVDVAFVNKGDKELPLTFSAEPIGIGFAVETIGHRPTYEPSGSCPSPARISEHFPRYARLTLPPHGEARARFGWDALQWRYGAPIKTDEGGCKIVSAGGIAKGSYLATIVVSLWTKHPTGPPEWAQSWPQPNPTFTFKVE